MILDAFDPRFAHRTVQADPSNGLLLPGNVIARATPVGTVVEIIDLAMTTVLTRAGRDPQNAADTGPNRQK